jgi:hypothetical protein
VVVEGGNEGVPRPAEGWNPRRNSGVWGPGREGPSGSARDIYVRIGGRDDCFPCVRGIFMGRIGKGPRSGGIGSQRYPSQRLTHLATPIR